jgi:hypothetical protein
MRNTILPIRCGIRSPQPRQGQPEYQWVGLLVPQFLMLSEGKRWRVEYEVSQQHQHLHHPKKFSQPFVSWLGASPPPAEGFH